MSPEQRHRVIARGFQAIALTGADRLLAPLARGSGVILTFHHVRPARDDPFQPNRLLEITPDFLDRTLALLRRTGYEIVPLDAVPDRLAAPATRPFAALTFDDGYRDNRDYAAPILERHGAPWTSFVVSDFASGTGRLWWLELEEVIRRRERMRFELDGAEYDLRTRDAAEKAVAFATIYDILRGGSEGRLRAVIGGWYAELGLDADTLVRSLCLSWEEIATLAGHPGVTIGAHTLSHPMLGKHDEAAARREIEGSRAAIEARLGRPVRHFAYPVGDPTSAGPRDFALAAAAGFATAVTTRPGHLFAAHTGHLAALPRVSVNGLFQSEAALRTLLSGVPFWLWNRGRRLNVG